MWIKLQLWIERYREPAIKTRISREPYDTTESTTYHWRKAHVRSRKSGKKYVVKGCWCGTSSK